MPFSMRELGGFYGAKRANTSGEEDAASDSNKNITFTLKVQIVHFGRDKLPRTKIV